MASSAEELTSNLQILISISKKAIEVLNTAKNKDNHEISDIVGIPTTTISTILNRAKRFGYVEKKNGKWIKTKEIKGYNLYRVAKVRIVSLSNKDRDMTKKVTRTISQVTPLRYHKQAAEMIEPYRFIFCLENTIRDFIRETIGKDKGWMLSNVDKKILEDIERVKKEPYYAHGQRKDDLEYATLGHLLHIIISNRNWKDFLPRLKEKNKNNFINTFSKVLPSRNSTGHCVALSKQDRNLIESRVREITLMFNFVKDETKT